MNRENYGQVTRDILRFIEQINDLERVGTQAIEEISQKAQEIRDVACRDGFVLSTSNIPLRRSQNGRHHGRRKFDEICDVCASEN